MTKKAWNLYAIFLAVAIVFISETPAFSKATTTDPCEIAIVHYLSHLLTGKVQPIDPYHELREQERELIEARRSTVLYSQIPSAADLHLPKEAPTIAASQPPRLDWATDPFLKNVIAYGAGDDLKTFADASPDESHSPFEAKLHQEVLSATEAVNASSPEERHDKVLHSVQTIFNKFYRPKERETMVPENLVPNPVSPPMELPPHWRDAWKYADSWGLFLRTPKNPSKASTLITTPYPFLVPALVTDQSARFDEWYYWDQWPAVEALLKTGRLNLAQMVAENFLEMIRRYGFVPNGGRTYYLSRSQPPVVYLIVRKVFEASLQSAKTPEEKKHVMDWLKYRALPLLKLDYEKFWMGKDHLDPTTHLNLYSGPNLPRPEKHGKDIDGPDTRPQCESGRDFTAAYAPISVQLNSLLYTAEQNLAWFEGQIGENEKAEDFIKASQMRRQRMNEFLWNPKSLRYENASIRADHTIERNPILSADAFFPYFAGVVESKDYEKISGLLGIYQKLITSGGIMASDAHDSHHQWDSNNVWAPDQIVAFHALENFGYRREARELAKNFLSATAEIFRRDGAFYERINGEKRTPPESNGLQYTTQRGFLWTNAAFIDLVFGLQRLRMLIGSGASL